MKFFRFSRTRAAAAVALCVLPACGGAFEEDLGAGQAVTSETGASIARDDGEIGALEQRLQNCANPDGTNAIMAAFAVAVGQELKRWDATKDFKMSTTSGQSEGSPGRQQALQLASGTGPDGKPRGKSRCADGKCAEVQAILDMQYEQARGKVYVQGESSKNKVLLDPAALRSRLVAKAVYEQKTCDDNAKDGDPKRCPKEAHQLTPVGSASLGGCGPHFKFAVKNASGAALKYPAQLKGKLTFADQTNGWVDFRNLGGGYVAIDPTYGLNASATTASGSCMAACTRISKTSVAGQCCSCGTATKKFVKSAWSATTFLCQ